MNSVVQQLVKCNTGKVCNYLIQFLLTYGSMNEIFGDSLETCSPLDRRILLHQTFICGDQQNLQCIVIVHARLMS
jgi:hypothetical protein